MGLFSKKNKEVEEEETTYEVGEFCCGNCDCEYYGEDENSYFDIPKGTTLKDYFKDKICPNCGCKIIQ